MLPHYEAQAKKRQQAAGETHGRGQEKVTPKMAEPIDKGKARQSARISASFMTPLDLL